MLIYHQVLSTLRRSSGVLPRITRGFSSIFESENKDNKENIKSVRQLKKWRITHERPDSALKIFNIMGDRDDSFFMGPAKIVKPTELKYWWRAKQREYLRWNQRFIHERHETLGNHLAATHFALHRNGKVRQKDCMDFLTQDDIETLPTTFNPNWLIEEIEFIGSEICYEGLENFQDLRTMRKATFKNCENFDDWCLERILCFCPNLEYLDVSGCEKVTERGLEGVYRSWHLQTLIITDFRHTAAFELTCLMLEDCMADLKIEVIKAPQKNEIEKKE